MTRMTVRGLEARAAFAEVDFPRDASADHPLQRPVDGRPADAGRLAADEIEQVVCTDVPFLAQEDREDSIALARTLTAGRTKR